MTLRRTPSRWCRALIQAAGLVLLTTFTPIAAGSDPEELSTDDWAGIRLAHLASRHAIQEVPDGYHARNPGQRFTTRFDGRAFLTVPDAGGWSWGLELARYGWGELQSTARTPQSLTVTDGRLTYDWDDRLSEWYLNDTRGLEHGFRVHARPVEAGANAALTLELAVRGDLSPVIAPNGRDLSFVDAQGTSVLTYSGLVAFDADARPLEASFERSGSSLVLRVEDAGARYPLIIDPVAQQAYLKASNSEIGDLFGGSVAVSGDTVVVGAIGEDSSATGVNGNQTDNSMVGAGAAYAFVRDEETWSQQAYLKATNTGTLDQFGYSVAISGDTIVVGAPFEDSNASGVNGDGGNDVFTDSGAAYVFVREGTSWHRQAYLKASNPGGIQYGFTDGDQFGTSVSISGDTVVVGALFESSNATGVDGDQSDNTSFDSGAAYVFVRSGTTWNQEAYLKSSNSDNGDVFGSSVSISGNTLVVGAGGEDSNATGVDGSQNNDSTSASGAAYVFARNGTTWSQEAYLKASNTETHDFFGWSVAYSSDLIVVGAYGEDSGASGVNGDESDNSSLTSGAAYVFRRKLGSWIQEAYLKASNPGSGDQFGYWLSLSGDTVAVGAFDEDSSATGVNCDQTNDDAPDSGAAYVFVREGTAWSQAAYLKASNSEADDLFGFTLAVSDETLVVGALAEDSNAADINGNQDNNSAGNAGAAYIFDLAAPEPITPLCFGDGTGTPCPCANWGGPSLGCSNSTGTGGLLTASGSASVGALDLVLAGTGLVPAAPGLYLQGDQTTAGGLGFPFGDGLRCAGMNLMRLEVQVADALGTSSTTSPIATAGDVLAGDARTYQLYYRDPTGSPCLSGFNFTNALRILWSQ